jgi:hypothetical protein
MTEEEWLKATNPTPMLEFRRGKASDRKFRLYACAACRGKWRWFEGDEWSRQAIEIAEQFADGDASKATLSQAAKNLPRGGGVAYHVTLADGSSGALNLAGLMAEVTVIECQDAGHGDEEAEKAKTEENGVQAFIVRDIFGNPFRPLAVDRAWLTSTVVALAEGIYADRAFDRMPILADALQDAGCDSEDILAHCRDTQRTHVRGCWVIDLLTGRG